MPPQNSVDRAIVDVSTLGVELAYPDASLAPRRVRDRPIEPEVAARARYRKPRLATTAGHSEAHNQTPQADQRGPRILGCAFGLWSDWQHALLLVKPETVIGWHRKGFRLYWTWKSRSRSGRPRIDPEIRTLVDRMARENPTWGAPRIHGELLMLGFNVSEATVSRYMPRRRKPPSQSWRTFLRNHANGLVSIDFFVVPTATFRVLYVFLVLEHERRRIVHFNVTEGPSAQWTGQQLVNAFPYDSAPKYVIRDRDKIYGANFVRRVHAMGIEQVLTAPRSPWQNPYCERVIGTLRRDCLDHVIVVGEQHLRRILRKYLEYYHGSRTHLALDKDAPEPRQRESIDGGKVIALPMVGGLHHRYTRRAA